MLGVFSRLFPLYLVTIFLKLFMVKCFIIINSKAQKAELRVLADWALLEEIEVKAIGVECRWRSSILSRRIFLHDFVTFSSYEKCMFAYKRISCGEMHASDLLYLEIFFQDSVGDVWVCFGLVFVLTFVSEFVRVFF